MKNLILIYGQDSYRMKKKLKELTNQALQDGFLIQDLNFDQSYSKEELQRILQNNLFWQPKLFIFRQAIFNLPANVLKFISQKLRENKKNIAIFFELLESNRINLNFDLKETQNYYFPLLSGQKMVAWIKAEVKEAGGKIDSKAANYLAFMFSPDSWMISSQIKKLVSFKDKQLITLEDVLSLCQSNQDVLIFNTLDAIATKKRVEAIKNIQLHLSKGESPNYILAMLFKQFKNMLLIKELDSNKISASQINMHPYLQNKLKKISSLFSVQDLKKIIFKLFQLDLKIKAGELNPQIALELFVAEMS